MKYNEAIDMILEGGEAYAEDMPDYRYKFDHATGYLTQSINGDSVTQDCIFDKLDFTESRWLVEKDGVVYEDAPRPKEGPFIQHIEKSLNEIADKWIEDLNNRISNASTLFIKDRIHEQDEPVELEENEQKWGRIKMPIIADSVNEEWLEKKMLCFLRRVGLVSQFHTQEEQRGKFIFGTCFDNNCPFCFPEDDHIPDVGKMVEEPREKVNLDSIMYLIDKIIKLEADQHMGSENGMPSDILADWELEQKRTLNTLNKVLEYLVSLQDK